MRKLIIKLPDPRVNKFRLQRRGMKGRRYLRAASLLRTLSRYKFKEKTAIVVKEYIDGKFKIINESLVSNDRDYLLFTASCFLENFLSKRLMNEFKIK